MSTDDDRRPLTSYSHGAGCGCKLPVGALSSILATLVPGTDPNLLVGTATGDDAAVYRLSDDRALVATVDFFTPIVDNPRTWGQIAAVNAVSDVYAMGGRPLLALNILAWNLAELGTEMLSEVLAGGQVAANDAGFVIAGGHSIDDPEPKYGLAVIGEVAPSRMLTNAGFRAGDTLVLTKPLGVGVLTTAAKRGLGDPATLQPALGEMTRLNAEASRVAVAVGSTGATDITGFGLLGHLLRAAQESAVEIRIDADSVPMLPHVRELVAAGAVPGGGLSNRDHVRPAIELSHLADDLVALLCDPQTSGGLVFGAPQKAVDDVLVALKSSGHTAAAIGHVGSGPAGVVVD